MASTPTRSAASTLLPSLRHLQFSGTAAAAATDVLSKSNLLNSSCVPIDGALLTSPNHLVRKNIEEKTYWLIHARSNSRWTPLSKASGFTSCAATLCTSRSFCSHPLNPINESQGAAAIDYCSVLQEDEFHKLADSTIHDLLEKLEEYGDSIDIDGFDIDYGNEVLTLKLGDLGTYVVNKQTPNRQIWLSSPVSGPSRFDWDRKAQAWIYRRTQANLLKVLETEIQKLCGKPLTLS